MIGLDTNVLVRYLVQDDPKQATQAQELIERALSADTPGFVSQIVLCELVWVLEDCYGQSRSQIAAILRTLFAAVQISVEKVDLAWRALRALESRGADFSDALIGFGGLDAGCRHTATFDKTAARLEGFKLLG